MVAAEPEEIFHPVTERDFRVCILRSDGVQRQKDRLARKFNLRPLIKARFPAQPGITARTANFWARFQR
jgi:hypothetical protein